MEDGLHQGGPTAAASLELLAALCRSFGGPGARVAMGVAMTDLAPALLRPLMSAHVEIRRMEAAGGQVALERACESDGSDATESATLLTTADQAGYAADVIAALARANGLVADEPSSLLEGALPHLMRLAKARNMGAMQTSALSALADVASLPATHTELVASGACGIIDTELRVVSTAMADDGEAEVILAGPGLVVAWMIAAMAASTEGCSGLAASTAADAAAQVVVVCSERGTHTEMGDGIKIWYPLLSPLLRTLSQIGVSDTATPRAMSALLRLAETAVTVGDWDAAAEAGTALAGVARHSPSSMANIPSSTIQALLKLAQLALPSGDAGTLSADSDPGSDFQSQRDVVVASALAAASMADASDVCRAGGTALAVQALSQYMSAIDQRRHIAGSPADNIVPETAPSAVGESAASLLCSVAHAPNGPTLMVEAGAVQPLSSAAHSQWASPALRKTTLDALAAVASCPRASESMLGGKQSSIQPLLAVIAGGVADNGTHRPEVMQAASILATFVEQQRVSGEELLAAGAPQPLAALLSAALEVCRRSKSLA